MEEPPSQADNEKERDQQLAAELELLMKERDEILSAAQDEQADLFRDIVDQTRRRLKLTADHRDFQLANIRSNFQVEVQQAWNEFERSKRSLRSEILAKTVERRRRLESRRVGVGAKRKKRIKAGNDRAAKLQLQNQQPFLGSLEKQGMFKISATPDEVNNDLAVILNGIDSAKTNGAPTPLTDRSSGPDAKSGDKVHSSRGILHYHDTTYEKGDRVFVYGREEGSSSKLTLKYSGVVSFINAAEFCFDRDSGLHLKIYVKHLRSGKFILKPNLIAD